MLKKFLTATALFLLYFIAWIPVYLAVIFWYNNNPNLHEGLMIGAILSLMLFTTIGMIPALNQIAKRVFYFPGSGDPLEPGRLREEIEAINRFDVPVQVIQKGKKYIITWNYVDAKWWGVLSKSGLKKVYELHVKLNEEKREAILIDVNKTVSWGVSPIKVSVYGGYQRGIAFGYEAGIQWGITEAFELGKIYKFQFRPSEIKDPVLNTILESGWNVRFSMW